MNTLTLTTFAASAAPADPKAERVAFEVDGIEVVGTLYLPEGVYAHPVAAVVIGGSLTSVKEMMGGTYGRAMAERGIAALAIDYRNFGESGGTPRFYDDAALKTADLAGAITYLQSRSEIDPARVGLLGICTSGGNVLYAAAADDRVFAVATVAGWFAEPSLTPVLYGSAARVAELRGQAALALREFRMTGDNRVIPAYSDVDPTASHVGPMEYYMDKTRGGGVPQWQNSLAVASWEPWLDFDPVGQASRVTAPTLIIHSKGAALPEQAEKVFAALPGTKEIAWMSGAHFDFYDHADKVAESADAIAAFLAKQEPVQAG